MTTVEQIMEHLRQAADPSRRIGMSRVGIDSGSALGVKIPQLRAVAKRTGRDQPLAEGVWATGVHECRILASMVAEPERVDEALIKRWAADFRSWDLCDQCCNNLFRKTDLAWRLVTQWPHEEDTFRRRIGFVTAACLAVHDKKRDDADFETVLLLCEQYASDDRNLVKKAVNWAVRQVGKRSRTLHPKALETAYRIQEQGTKSACWIAGDAIRELRSEKILARIR